MLIDRMDRLEARVADNIQYIIHARGILPVKNGVMDFSILDDPGRSFADVWEKARAMFRPTRMDDYVSPQGQTDWAWSEEAAQKHLPDVDRFLGSLFPVEEERKRVLRLMASIFNKRRSVKKGLVLVDQDNRSGNNGKSSFNVFLATFFGEQFVSKEGKAQLAVQPKTNRNSHAGNDQYIAKMRFIVADEISGVIDSSRYKDLLAGGKAARQEGRGFMSGERFNIEFNGAVMMSFNINSAPTFSKTDEPLEKRMMCIPMRSIFVSEDDRVNEASYCFKEIADMQYAMSPWGPAIFIRVLEEFRPDCGYDLSDTPDMLQVKQSLADRQDPAVQRYIRALREFMSGGRGGARRVPIDASANAETYSTSTADFKRRFARWLTCAYNAPVDEMPILERNSEIRQKVLYKAMTAMGFAKHECWFSGDRQNRQAFQGVVLMEEELAPEHEQEQDL